MTSIEWLIEQLIYKSDFEHLPNNYFLMSDKDIDNIIEQSKEMHKQEIIDAYNTSFRLRDKPYETSEKYYNETFKKD